MWVYDIFPGVQLMVVDFAIESCFRGSGKENVIEINHCEKGRYECAFDNKSYIYLGEGDIAINSQLHPPVASSFPLKYYYGSTILLFPEIMKRGHELQAFQISAEKIVEKYSLNTECHVYRRNAEIEHLPCFSFYPPSVCVLLSYYKDNENWRIYIRTYQNAHAVRGCNTTGGNVPFCSHDSGGMANGKSGTPPEGAGMELAQCFDSTCPYVGVYDGSFFDAMLRCCG